MKVAVFCASSHPKDKSISAVASALGKSLAARGYSLIYGGSNLGLMGTVSSAALDEGGYVAAVIPTLFSEEVILSQQVTELIRVRSMAERKERILSMSDAFIALPGGIGTLDEVSEVMVANQLLQFNKPMILLNLGGFFDTFLLQLDVMREQGLLRSNCGLRVASSVEKCIAMLSPYATPAE